MYILTDYKYTIYTGLYHIATQFRTTNTEL